MKGDQNAGTATITCKLSKFRLTKFAFTMHTLMESMSKRKYILDRLQAKV